MKKLLLLAVLGVTAVSAMAQGRITFRNTASTSFNLYTNDAFGSLNGVSIINRSTTSNSAAQYRVGLYASPTTGASAGSLTLIALATNASSANPSFLGKFLGPDPYAITAPGYAAGSAFTFQLRGWSFAGGMTYEEAVLAQVLDPLNIALGQSELGTTTPTASPGTPGALFGTAAGLLVSGFEIKPAPEPSSIALGLLGLGAVALFRRKK
jgi:hypothetical protein